VSRGIFGYVHPAKKNKSGSGIKKRILEHKLADGNTIVISKGHRTLVVAYAGSRAAKDAQNRHRGLQRLEKQLKRGKLTKAHINNKGYNKYLKMTGDIDIQIDYEKYHQDAAWDGLKGYITNAALNPQQVIENYNHLWQIEKAFRMSKTDLCIRPIYHRLADRIDAHICISFTAYAIYKDLERVLQLEKIPLSVKKAAEQTQNMYQLEITLPESKMKKTVLLKMTDTQNVLAKLIAKYY
jgi:hypothetical protein